MSEQGCLKCEAEVEVLEARALVAERLRDEAQRERDELDVANKRNVEWHMMEAKRAAQAAARVRVLEEALQHYANEGHWAADPVDVYTLWEYDGGHGEPWKVARDALAAVPIPVETVEMNEKGEDHTFSDEALARIARDLRCAAPAPGGLDIFCGRRLGHKGPHVGISLDGDPCEWNRTRAASSVPVETRKD